MRKPNKISWWKLCLMVEKKLKDEPQYYCQEDWNTPPERRQYRGMVPLEPRECGTAHCIGGWMSIIIGNTALEIERSLTKIGAPTHELFAATSHWESRTDTGGKIIKLPQTEQRGTPEYAALGIDHLRKYMTQYERILKTNFVGGADHENRASWEI